MVRGILVSGLLNYVCCWCGGCRSDWVVGVRVFLYCERDLILVFWGYFNSLCILVSVVMKCLILVCVL